MDGQWGAPNGSQREHGKGSMHKGALSRHGGYSRHSAAPDLLGQQLLKQGGRLWPRRPLLLLLLLLLRARVLAATAATAPAALLVLPADASTAPAAAAPAAPFGAKPPATAL